MDMKNKLDQMTNMERNERKYGLLVRNDPDYLNPVLSQRYIERTYLEKKL